MKIFEVEKKLIINFLQGNTIGNMTTTIVSFLVNIFPYFGSQNVKRYQWKRSQRVLIVFQVRTSSNHLNYFICHAKEEKKEKVERKKKKEKGKRKGEILEF